VKRISGQTWTGIILIATGVIVCGIWILWAGVLVVQPVSMPVSLAVGEVRTPQFKVPVNQYYIISIEAKKRLPFDVLNCMMGISLVPNNCGKEPILQAKWTLWSDGQIVGQGSSDEHRGGGWENDTVQCMIGKFKGRPGDRYVLVVDFTKDGSQLAVTDPRLKVHLADAYYGMTETLYVFALFVLIEGIGMVLLISSAVRYWRNRSGRVAHPKFLGMRVLPMKRGPILSAVSSRKGWDGYKLNGDL
jgi:hypothetical protein